jgi:hypothetical protein
MIRKPWKDADEAYDEDETTYLIMPYYNKWIRYYIAIESKRSEFRDFANLIAPKVMHYWPGCKFSFMTRKAGEAWKELIQVELEDYIALNQMKKRIPEDITKPQLDILD